MLKGSGIVQVSKLRLISSVLDLSFISARKQPQTPRPITIHDVGDRSDLVVSTNSNSCSHARDRENFSPLERGNQLRSLLQCKSNTW